MNNLDNWFEQYKPIVIGLVLLLFMAILYYCDPQFADSHYWKLIDAFATAWTLLLVGMEVWDNKKQFDIIKIKIKRNNEEQEIPSYILRKNFTRSEVQGLLRSLHDGDIYDIDFTSKPEFLKAINAIQKGSSNIFLIPILPKDNFKLRKEYDNELPKTKISHQC